MRIAQVVLPGAPAYERKCQRVDYAALSERHDVTVVAIEDIARSGAAVAHVYAGRELPASAFVRFAVPYVATAPLPRSRWSWRKPVAPRFVVSPVGENALPEAVEEKWFSATYDRVASDVKVLGSFARTATRDYVERTLARISRTRSDITWKQFDDPSPEDLAGVDAWIDPAMSEDDYDGCVAEALVLGVPVVASRTPMNAQRLEQGRTGLLVPMNDPNEMTHAILAALFKNEVAESRKIAAKQTVSKLRPRQRLRLLTRLYEQSIS